MLTLNEFRRKECERRQASVLVTVYSTERPNYTELKIENFKHLFTKSVSLLNFLNFHFSPDCSGMIKFIQGIR